MQTPRTGTIAGAHIDRGDLGDLTHPDYAALAYMDDVATLDAPSAWRGSWQLDAGATLDLHQLAFNGSAILTARATAIMGRPEESNYAFRPVVWRGGGASTTCIDLVFEPRLGAATLAAARSIAGPAAALRSASAYPHRDRVQRVLLPASTNHTVCTIILKSNLSEIFSM